MASDNLQCPPPCVPRGAVPACVRVYLLPPPVSVSTVSARNPFVFQGDFGLWARFALAVGAASVFWGVLLADRRPDFNDFSRFCQSSEVSFAVWGLRLGKLLGEGFVN